MGKFINLNLHHLLIFYFVASERSFSEASQKLFMTQPGVSFCVKSLERGVGAKLLHVRKKRVYLTTVGETLFRYAKVIREQAKEAEKFIEGIGEDMLSVGTSLTFSSITASVASIFEELFPEVNLSVANAPSFEVIEKLLDFQYDIAVVFNMDYSTSKLEAIRVSEGENLVLVAAPSHPIFGEKELRLADIYNYPLVLGPPKSATRRILLQKFIDIGLGEPPIRIEINHVASAKKLVEEGRGIDIMHRSNIEMELAEGKLKILPVVAPIKVGVNVLFHRDIPLNRVQKKFIQLAKEAFKES